ncbi:MAG: glycosyltransferase family 39 protein, partial [bacterium]
LYSALIALVSFVTGNVEVSALAISILGGTVAVVATYIFLRDAFDERVAAFGSLLFAISPYAVRFTADVQSEGLYLAFFVSGVTTRHCSLPLGSRQVWLI